MNAAYLELEAAASSAVLLESVLRCCVQTYWSNRVSVECENVDCRAVTGHLRDMPAVEAVSPAIAAGAADSLLEDLVVAGNCLRVLVAVGTLVGW